MENETKANRIYLDDKLKHTMIALTKDEELFTNKISLEHNHMYHQHHHQQNTIRPEQEQTNNRDRVGRIANISANIYHMLETSTAREYLENDDIHDEQDDHDHANHTKDNHTKTYWQHAQDAQKTLNVSLETMKEKNERINASRMKMEITKRNAVSSWPVHINRFAEEEIIQIGEPAYLSLVTQAMLVSIQYWTLRPP